MGSSNTYREPGYVAFHLNGYTKVVLERFIGIGHANGGVEWEIPTEDIPPHLRTIGSRLLLIGEFPKPSRSASGEDVRLLLRENRLKARIIDVDDVEFPPPGGGLGS